MIWHTELRAMNEDCGGRRSSGQLRLPRCGLPLNGAHFFNWTEGGGDQGSFEQLSTTGREGGVDPR